jgi:hypothetical protein
LKELKRDKSLLGRSKMAKTSVISDVYMFHCQYQEYSCMFRQVLIFHEFLALKHMTDLLTKHKCNKSMVWSVKATAVG